MTMKKIVLPEGDSKRVLLAAQMLIGAAVCHPVLIGDPIKISAELEANPDFYTVIEPDSSELDRLKKDAESKDKVFPVNDIALAQGAALVRNGKADGIVGGAQTATDDVFRVYIKVIGKSDKVSRVTSCFLIEKGDSRLIYADCGLNPTSNAEQLAETAYLSSVFAKTVDIEPRVAFLGFQTVGNASHDEVQKMKKAADIARKTYNLCAEGPLQFDSAFVPEVAVKKLKEGSIMGDAKVFIFPDLNSGNIAYKITERMGGYQATGPLFLGLNSPAYDLSRGCSAEDVVSVVRMAAQQAS